MWKREAALQERSEEGQVGTPDEAGEEVGASSSRGQEDRWSLS